MSASGVFIIISNDGKADRLINGTDVLDQQIWAIKDQKTQQLMSQGQAVTAQNTLPTIREIEETHLVPFQAKFKPPVPVAMEYQKVIAGAAINSFGQSL